MDTVIGVGVKGMVMASMTGTDGEKLMDFYAEKIVTVIGSIIGSIARITNWTSDQA